MSQPDHEPYEMSARFYLAMKAKALSLEVNASIDELRASTLKDVGHVKRQNRLVQAQRDQAERFRNFLADARIRLK